jgi:DNA-binding MarR family transcriptional regulator
MDASLEIGPDCFGFRARAAARAVTRVINAHLDPVALNVSQVTLLAALRQDDTLTLSALAETLQVEASALQRNLKILERRGFVIGDSGRGRRGRRSALTADGEAILNAATPLWRSAQAELRNALGDRAETTLAALNHLATTAGATGSAALESRD